MGLHAYLSPLFLMRRLCRRALETATRQFPAQGRLLDVGCGEKPHRDLFPGIHDYHGIDFRSFSANKDFSTGGPDSFFPEDYVRTFELPFPSSSFDHAAAFEVLEHHPRPDRLLAEFARVLRPKGRVYLTWPFLYPLHEEPHDYFRYTHHTLERFAADTGFRVVHLAQTGGFIASAVALLSMGLAQFHGRGGWRKGLALLAYPPLLLAQYAALPLATQSSTAAPLNYVAVLERGRSNDA